MTDLRPQLRLLAPPPPPPPPPQAQAAACPTSGCELPVAGSFGLCTPCERVMRTLLVLCDRLLDRDLARVEQHTPGLVLTARETIASIFVSPEAVIAPDHAKPAD